MINSNFALFKTVTGMELLPALKRGSQACFKIVKIWN